MGKAKAAFSFASLFWVETIVSTEKSVMLDWRQKENMSVWEWLLLRSGTSSAQVKAGVFTCSETRMRINLFLSDRKSLSRKKRFNAPHDDLPNTMA